MKKTLQLKFHTKKKTVKIITTTRQRIQKCKQISQQNKYYKKITALNSIHFNEQKNPQNDEQSSKKNNKIKVNKIQKKKNEDELLALTLLNVHLF